MLIKFKDIINKYSLSPKGILHVGAHKAEEASDYSYYGINKVLWIEADRETFNDLEKVLKTYPSHKAYCFAASDVNDKEVDFHVANNGQSSSILEMETHLVEHPQVKIVEKKKVSTKRIDTFLEENNINLENYNFLNLDIQGAELLALKGMGEQLEKVDYIYTEVNVDEVYKDCAKMTDIDSYLSDFGFKRVETKLTKHGWGDAFYMKND